MEEFLDKYVEVSNNNIDTNNYNNDNRELLNLLTERYQIWLSKEKGITKKINKERIIKLIQDAEYFDNNNKLILDACKLNPNNDNDNNDKKRTFLL